MSSPRSSFPIPLVLFTGTAAVFVASVLGLALFLPERVATHFGLHGEADGWMTADAHVRFLIVVGLGLSGFLIALCHGLRFLPPQFLNVPDAQFWRSPDHYPEACHLIARWSWHVASVQLLFLGTLNYVLVAANQLSPPRLSTAAIVLPLAIFLTGLGALVWGLFRSLRQARAALGSPS